MDKQDFVLLTQEEKDEIERKFISMFSQNDVNILQQSHFTDFQAMLETAFVEYWKRKNIE